MAKCPFYEYCKEFYAVQEVSIIIALKKGNTISYNKLEKGDSILIEPMIEHNVYMYAKAKTIVVKFGNTKERDWNLAESLDKETKEYKF